MKEYIFTAVLMLAPVVVMADRPEGGIINDIKSEIRDGYRQLEEDRAAGDINAVREDEREIAEDKLRLREAMRYPHRTASSAEHFEELQPAAGGETVYAAPPEEKDALRRDPNYHPDKLNPAQTFNHAGHVDNEIR